MSTAQLVPLSNAPNQSIIVTLAINGAPLTLQIQQYYNQAGEFWCFDIYSQTGEPLILSVPLITGDWPAGNILSCAEWLLIGEAFVINQNGGITDIPNDQNLGQGFALIWDSNIGSGVAPGFPTVPPIAGSGDWSSYPVSELGTVLG
jgi:hypothetical protein